MINSDGISISGCNYIYAPKGQAGEYATLSTNIYRGCGHKCVYCYVPQVISMDRKEFDSGAFLRVGYEAGLLRDAKKYQLAGITEQVMLSFTSDPYHLGDTEPTARTIRVLKDHDMGFCTLTKGGTRSLRDLNLFRSDRDAFATTLTSLDDVFSKKWERDAALPADRINAIKKFKEAGIFTWVSIEPTINVDESIKIIKETYAFVDLFKIGRINYLPMTQTIDWKDYTHRVIDLCETLGIAHYIKQDLQQYLPDGYKNPLRVTQHHGSGL